MRLLTLLILVLVSPVAVAGVDAQAGINVIGSKSVSEKADLGMAGIVFLTPGNVPTYFYYAGPGFQVTDWWWTSPRGGLVLNWNDPDSSSSMMSWWNFVSLKDGSFTFFVETTALHVNDHFDYLGIYQADYNIDWLRMGAHVGQVNTNVTIGPHVGVALNDNLSTNVQYHWNLEDGHTIRVVSVLKFN